jgi:Mrp family chromosome partitioning ATPase
MIQKILQAMKLKNTSAQKKSIPPLGADTNVLQQVTEFVHYAEFKRILDRVVNAHLQDKVKSIAILSELPGEGKTLLTAALAVGLSELLNSKILVIDTQTFAAPNSLTLDRALETDELPSAAKPTQKTLLVKADLLPMSRQQNKSKDGIVEYKINDLIQEYSSRYDLLLFDTSALSAKNRNNIDPWVIARHVDTNILVVGDETLKKNMSPSFNERRLSDKLKICGLIYNEGASS